MQRPLFRRWLIALGVALAALYFAFHLWLRVSLGFAYDFAINWTGAVAQGEGISLYDHVTLHQLGLQLIGPEMADTFRETYNSYIGPPTTALMYRPFAGLPFGVGLSAYRLLSAAAFLLAILLTGLALPRPSRRLAWLVGLVMLLVSEASVASLQLGQVDAWIALALATSVLLASRRHEGAAGIGIGLAALLKVSPALIIVYCLLRGKVRMAATAVATVASLLALATLVGPPGDFHRFVTVVAPSLSAASLHIQNQSMAAWLARLAVPETNLTLFSAGLGAFVWLSVPIAAGLLGSAWNRWRQSALISLELGLLIVVSLLVGPLTWAHYASWALVSVVLVADRRLWDGWPPRQRAILLLAFVLSIMLLALPTLYFGPAIIDGSWWLRLATGLKTTGLLLLLAVGFALDSRVAKSPVPALAPLAEH